MSIAQGSGMAAKPTRGTGCPRTPHGASSAALGLRAAEMGSGESGHGTWVREIWTRVTSASVTVHTDEQMPVFICSPGQCVI